MATQQEEFLAIGRFWAEVSEEHNLEKFSTILSDDFVMWYNFENIDRNRVQFLETLRSSHKVFQNQANENVRLTPTADGFVLQATMRGNLLGKEVFAPYCLIAKIRDGKIVRGEEYFDTFQLGSRPAPGSTEMISAEPIPV